MPGGTPNFGTANEQEIEAAAPERFTSNDLNGGQVLDPNRFVEALSIQSDRSTKYAPGLGYRNRDYASGWADIDIQGDNVSTNGTNITGVARWEYYSDSDKESLEYTSGTFRIEELRASVSDSRTEKMVMHQLAPAVNEDGYLVLAIKADPPYDGDSIDAAASTEGLGVPYAKFKV